jgi:hypothetical protein
MTTNTTADDDTAAVRLTGHTARQLAVQILGGLLMAAIVGAVSAWGTQQVLGAKLEFITREVQQLRGDMQEIRRDMYRPRFERGGYTAGLPLPAGRP